MKKILTFLFLLVLLIPVSYGVTETDKSYKITIDGKTDDYDKTTESLFRNSSIALESSFDSYWGKENEVTDIKCTWDANYLYIALNSTINGNNLMFFIDSIDGGIPDFKPENSSESISWNRSLTFVKYYPDFYLGTWPDNSTPENYKALSEIRDEKFYNSTDFESAAYLPTAINGAIEMKIAWSTLFGTTPGNVPIGAKVKLSACVTGSWGGSTPDVIPDNSAGASTDGQQRVIIDNFAIVNIDDDNDGKPDIGVNPAARTTFIISSLPNKPNPINITNLKVYPKIISTLHGHCVFISFYLNISKNITVKVFNMKGDFIKTIIYNKTAVIGENNKDTNPSLYWDGTDEQGKTVPEGIYIISVTDEDKTFRKLVAVAVVH